MLSMCMFVNQQVNDKYKLRKEIGSSSLCRCWHSAILFGLIHTHQANKLIINRCCQCVCLWTSRLMASTDSERTLFLVSCTNLCVMQFWIILYGLIHFACWFKSGVFHVYICGLASCWQVQTWKEDWLSPLCGPWCVIQYVCLWIGKWMTSTVSDRQLVGVLVQTLVVQFCMSLYSLIHFGCTATNILPIHTYWLLHFGLNSKQIAMFIWIYYGLIKCLYFHYFI